MNIKDVPNDHEAYKGISDLRKKLYVTADDGHYTSVNSDGWDVENFATKQAWEAAEEEIEQIRQQVIAGVLSPIAFHMHRCLMELPILAKYVGKWQWQVKRHLKPEVFKKLNKSMLEKYAAVFGISVQELLQQPNPTNSK